MEERKTRTGGSERRNYTPVGRLRRIFFDHRRSTLTLLGCLALVAALFVGTTAFTVNERFKRQVTEIAYTHDVASMQFLVKQEQLSLAKMASRERELAAKQEELAPADRPYLVVSLEEKMVWYLRGEDTLFRAPVAVGSGKTLVINGVTKRFQTPRGRMSITQKERDPVWVPPDWHYIEIARRRGLRVVNMGSASPNALAGFPAGREPISGGTIYIPPWGSPQRRHTGVLGVAKLEMYDGYYFHGTDNEGSVGTAASHGCIRMRRDDILWMYDNVPVGTAVYIY